MEDGSELGGDCGSDLDEGQGITPWRFLELIIIGVSSSVVILELIWTINDYRENIA